MTDCWLDPYGNVYYVEFGKHDDFAYDYLQDEFPSDRREDWTSDLVSGSYVETLMSRGWTRYTTTSEQWCYGRDWGGWERYPRPTRAQRDRMFDLTGEIVE